MVSKNYRVAPETEWVVDRSFVEMFLQNLEKSVKKLLSFAQNFFDFKIGREKYFILTLDFPLLASKEFFRASKSPYLPKIEFHSQQIEGLW